MNNLVIMKLYKNEESQSDFHDINFDDYTMLYNELESYAKLLNIDLYFTIINASDDIEFPSKSFAEIEYTGELSKEIKDKFTKFLIELSKNAFIDYDTLNDYNTLKFIKYRKINTDEEIVYL